MIPLHVAGTGSYVPEDVLTNFDLEKTLNTTDEWIVKRTGIKERRIARPDQAASHLALEASLMALEDAGMSASELDYIIMATITPDTCCPSGANWLQAKLNCPQAISFDVTAACSGYVFAMDVAASYLQSGRAKNVLVVASEIMSRVQDWTDRSNCVLWGDGAGAMILKPGEGIPCLLDTFIGSDGSQGDSLLMPGGGSATTPISYESVDKKLHTLKMIGAHTTVRMAVKYFAESVHAILERNNRSIDEVAHFIPHQANLRMLQSLAKRLHVDMDRFVLTVSKYANISSASCAIALDEAIRSGRIQPGDLACLTVFGGGLTWGSALIQF